MALPINLFVKQRQRKTVIAACHLRNNTHSLQQEQTITTRLSYCDRMAFSKEKLNKCLCFLNLKYFS